jgi:hypothetical protein
MIIAATNNPSIEPKTIPINPAASGPAIISPKPGNKTFVPLPAMAPTKPQNKAPDAADTSIKRKFDIINPPRRNKFVSQDYNSKISSSTVLYIK